MPSLMVKASLLPKNTLRRCPSVFIDWDHVIARRRQVNVTVMGTTEDVGDRKWNDGKVIDTKRKFTEEEKAYDIHYDLQQQR